MGGRAKERVLRVVDPVDPLLSEVRRIEEALGQAYIPIRSRRAHRGGIPRGAKLQIKRLTDAQHRLDKAIRRSEAVVRATMSTACLQDLAP
jgi:hypothetical protein